MKKSKFKEFKVNFELQFTAFGNNGRSNKDFQAILIHADQHSGGNSRLTIEQKQELLNFYVEYKLTHLEEVFQEFQKGEKAIYPLNVMYKTMVGEKICNINKDQFVELYKRVMQAEIESTAKAISHATTMSLFDLELI